MRFVCSAPVPSFITTLFLILLLFLSSDCEHDLLDPLDAISSLAHHITFLSQCLDAEIHVASKENGGSSLSGSSESYTVSCICSILNTAITEGQRDVTVAMLAALQTLMRQVNAGWAKLDENDVTETRRLLWKLICAPADSVEASVQLETSKVVKAGLETFYPTATERSSLLMLLLLEGHSTHGRAQLLDILLIHLAEKITHSDPRLSYKER